jgi:type VI secretion system protein ImpA
MPLIDLPKLLDDRQPGLPCGPDLEYSADYVMLSKLIEGQPEVQYGSMQRAAEAPAWNNVQSMSIRLLEQSHDLRVAVWLTSALLAQHAFHGLQAGLALIEGMVEQRWSSLHPQLDAEDGDPTIRINVLLALNDKTGMVKQVIAAPFVHASAAGNLSLRDILIATGEYTVAGHDKNTSNLAAIDVAFVEAPYAELSAVFDAIKHSSEGVRRLEGLLRQHVSGFEGFSALRNVLDRAATEMAARLAKHPGRAPDATFGDPAKQASVESRGHVGTLENRVDVLRAISLICDYYACHEPGSPVPLLLQRAKRLVDMDFVQIMKHLAPGGLDEVLKVAGLEKLESC